jgi:hypothetical protein
MNEITPGNLLVVMSVLPSLEEPVIDWLLARRDEGFTTSLNVYGHSSSHENLSPAEQVSGRQKRIIFQVEINTEEKDQFLAELKERFAGASIHYWIHPVIASGSLD